MIPILQYTRLLQVPVWWWLLLIMTTWAPRHRGWSHSRAGREHKGEDGKWCTWNSAWSGQVYTWVPLTQAHFGLNLYNVQVQANVQFTLISIWSGKGRLPSKKTGHCPESLCIALHSVQQIALRHTHPRTSGLGNNDTTTLNPSYTHWGSVLCWNQWFLVALASLEMGPVIQSVNDS